MSRLEGGLHGLKADSSARADDQDCRHGVMLPVGPALLTVVCDAGSLPARWAGALKPASKAVAVARRESYLAAERVTCLQRPAQLLQSGHCPHCDPLLFP